MQNGSMKVRKGVPGHYPYEGKSRTGMTATQASRPSSRHSGQAGGASPAPTKTGVRAERQSPTLTSRAWGTRKGQTSREKPQNLAETDKLCATLLRKTLPIKCMNATQASRGRSKQRPYEGTVREGRAAKPHAHKTSMGHPQRPNLKKRKAAELGKNGQALRCLTARNGSESGAWLGGLVRRFWA